MKYCTHCGNEMVDNAVLCVKCKKYTDDYSFLESENCGKTNEINNQNNADIENNIVKINKEKNAKQKMLNVYLNKNSLLIFIITTIFIVLCFMEILYLFVIKK